MLVIHEGMSGTGKSTALLQKITDEKRDVIYLVPDQMSVHTERYITSQMSNKATASVYVYTFKLLEKQILKQSENQMYKELGAIEQFFLLLRLLEKHESEITTLRYMKHNRDQLNECLELFTLWRNQLISPDMWHEVAVDGKLKDLLFLYEKFLAEQQEDMYFPEEVYRLASRSLDYFPFFAESVVVIDGFYLFSETEQIMLSHILKQAAEVHITFPQYLNGEMPSQIKLMKQQLIEQANKLKRPTKVQAYREIKRQEKMTLLASLIENLPNTSAELTGSGDSLAFIKAQTVDEEVHEIASQIRQLVMNQKADYSDCAIYLADMTTYKDKIIDLFALYDIPVFLDQKESIIYTPIAQLLKMILEIFTQKMTGQRLMGLLKTGYFMELSDVYAIEPVLQLFSLNDERAFSHEKWNLYIAQLSDKEVWVQRFETFQRIVDDLKEAKKHFSQKRTFGTKLEQLFQCFDHFQLFEQLNERGDSDVLQLFSRRIDELYNLFSGDRITSAMFAEVLEMVLNQLKLAKQPSSQNQVMIADFTRSRVSQNMQLSGNLGVKYVFIPGFIQGAMPPQSPEFTLLKNREIELEVLKKLLPSQQSEYELRYFYVYLAFAQASAKLTLSYAKFSRTNEENNPHRMFEILANRSQKPILSAQSIVKPYAPTTALLENEALLFSPYLESHEVLVQTRAEMEKIELAIEHGSYSVSQFERYNGCPFQYFLERRVGLRERFIGFTDTRTIGNITHDFMESVARMELDELVVKIPEQFVDAFLQAYEQEILGFSFLSENSYSQLLRHKISEHLQQNMLRYVKFRKSVRFIPYATEMVFKVMLAGREVRGKIDRVDLATLDNQAYFQVIDYKSGDKKFDWTSFVAGTQIQLPFYMYAKDGMQKKLPLGILPYGFYYQTLKVNDQNTAETVKLDGYTIEDKALIESICDDMSVYSGMKINKNGSFSQYAKTLSSDEIDHLLAQTEKISEATIKHIESNHFQVAPVAIKDKNGLVAEPKSCEYCRFQGICQRELLKKEHYRTVEIAKKEDVIE